MIMPKFNLKIHNGLPVIHDADNTILIDTGAMVTLHKSSILKFLSNNYEIDLEADTMGISVDGISELFGIQITTLLGTNILRDFIVIFDYKNKTVEFLEHGSQVAGIEIAIDSFLNIPIIEVLIDNRTLKFFLDTGARISYVSDSVLDNYTSVGTEIDFHPTTGEFETPLYEITTGFANNSFLGKYGKLPESPQAMLNAGGVDGIIGLDFFSNYKVALDLKAGRLWYERGGE